MCKLRKKYRKLYDAEHFEELVNVIDKKNTLSNKEKVLKAIGHIEQEQYLIAESILQQLLDEKEDPIMALYMLGKVKYKLEDFTSAAKFWQNALDSVSSDISQKMVARINLGLGMALIQLGKEKEGRVYLEKSLEINPDEHSSYEVYVEYLLERNHFLDAEKIIRMGISHFANSPDFFYYLCRIHQSQGNKKQAKKFAKKAKKLNNRHHSLRSEHIVELEAVEES